MFKQKALNHLQELQELLNATRIERGALEMIAMELITKIRIAISMMEDKDFQAQKEV